MGSEHMRCVMISALTLWVGLTNSCETYRVSRRTRFVLPFIRIMAETEKLIHHTCFTLKHIFWITRVISTPIDINDDGDG